MSTQQNYRPVLKQLLEALVKHPDFASIKEDFDRDMLAKAAYEACAILREKTRIREQAQKGDAAMKLYLETYPTPAQPIEEEFDPVIGMWLGGVGQLDAAEDLIRIPEIGQQSRTQEENPYFLIPGLSSESDDNDDFEIIEY
jgi:hypothetical protein